MTTHITINIDIIRAIALFSSKDPGRTTINGINVSGNVERTLFAATNGRCLALYKAQSFGDVSFEFNLSMTWLPMAINCRNKPILIECDEKSATVHLKNSIRIQVPHLEGTFPKLNGILDPGKFASSSQLCFNPELFALFQKASKLLDGKSLFVKAHEACSQLSVFMDDPNFYGVLMPMKSYNEKTLPNWLK